MFVKYTFGAIYTFERGISAVGDCTTHALFDRSMACTACFPQSILQWLSSSVVPIFGLGAGPWERIAKSDSETRWTTLLATRDS